MKESEVRGITFIVLLGLLICFVMRCIIFCEELNLKQVERETAEIVKQEEIEKLEYFQVLNEFERKKK